jgi:hypothetical protein
MMVDGAPAVDEATATVGAMPVFRGTPPRPYSVPSLCCHMLIGVTRSLSAPMCMVYASVCVYVYVCVRVRACAVGGRGDGDAGCAPFASLGGAGARSARTPRSPRTRTSLPTPVPYLSPQCPSVYPSVYLSLSI